MQYNYNKDTYNVDTDGSVSAQYYYPSTIEYTLKGDNNPSHYVVEFLRNNYSVGNSGTLTREDITLSARTGTLMAIQDLLTEVRVSLNEEGQLRKIRTYRFDYDISPFDKNQLSKIAEYDTADNLFYSNTLEYFDEVGSSMLVNPSNGDQIFWNGQEANLSGPLNDIIPGNIIIDEGSALGTSTSSGKSAGLRIGIGIGKNVKSVKTTIGGSFNYSSAKEKTKVSFFRY